MIQSVQAQNLEVEPNNFSWTGVLQAVSFAARSAAHTTMRATPMQLAFGRDAILLARHIADWQQMHNRKQSSAKKNDLKESK